MKKEIVDDPLTKAVARGDVDMYVGILKRFIERETSYRNKQKEGGKT